MTKTKPIYRIILRLHFYFTALITNKKLFHCVLYQSTCQIMTKTKNGPQDHMLQPLLLIRSCANACSILLKLKIN